MKAGDTVTLVYDLDEAPATADEANKGERNQNSRDFTVAGILDTGGNEEKYIFISVPDMEALTEKQMYLI